MSSAATPTYPTTHGATTRPSRISLTTEARLAIVGRVISGFLAIFLFVDGGARLAGFAPYVEGLADYGYPIELAPGIGIVLLVSTLLYSLPRTAVIGAVLVTGYLGGAIATHVRVGDPNYLFAVVFAVLIWVGVYLREPRLRELLPVR